MSFRYLCPPCKRGEHPGHQGLRCQCTCEGLSKPVDDKRERDNEITEIKSNKDIDQLMKEWRALHPKVNRNEDGSERH